MDVVLAAAADLEALVTLAVAFRDHLQETRPTPEAFRHGFAALLGDAATDFFVARDDGGAPSGYAQVRYRRSVWHGGQVGEVEDLFVAATARRGGAGRAILEHVLAHARSRGCTLMSLATNERNRAAVGLYRSLGFTAEKALWDGGRQLWLERPL